MKLPDGRVIKIGGERFEAPEILFQPHLIDCESVGIAELLFNTIQAADIDLRKTFYKHIVLSGGTTMYPGFASRLEREMTQLYFERILKEDTNRVNVKLKKKFFLKYEFLFFFISFQKKLKIKIENSARQKHMVFFGGSVLANIAKDREDLWIDKKEYQEQGLRCLNKLIKHTI